MLLPSHGDDVSSYETMTFPGLAGDNFLKFQPNGDCIYLAKDGCGIHGRVPFMCRVYDCREQHRMYTKEQRESLVKRGLLNADVLRRGAILLHQQSKVRATP
jgi:Fe-S-cluster containining protein